jgi:hypothetical protein
MLSQKLDNPVNIVYFLLVIGILVLLVIGILLYLIIGHS